MAWKFCEVCTRKGPVPECALCEKANGRAMTEDEATALLERVRKANASLYPAPEDWILDVPYDDGTTPRQRGD